MEVFGHVSDVDSSDNKLPEPATEAATERKIKKRNLVSKYFPIDLGRAANHPSFFIRRFFYAFESHKYDSIYQAYPESRERIRAKIENMKKSRYGTKDLKLFFGTSNDEDEQKDNYLNRKMLFKAISEESLDMVMKNHKCNEVLNHLISIEKYSSRLGSPELVERLVYK